MAYGIIHDMESGRARWTVRDGIVLDEDGTQVGTERDGVLYRMSGEFWGALDDVNSAAFLSSLSGAKPREKPDL